MNKLSIIIPARNEAENLTDCITEICGEIDQHCIDYEILVIDDGSTDDTAEIVDKINCKHPSVYCVKNTGENGFGRAVRVGLENYSGDAVAIMMADRSDSPKDLVNYWNFLTEKELECAFGSRFIREGSTHNYPKTKLVINRIVNTMIRIVFNVDCNDVTNAFKMYRREVIEGL